MSRIAAICTLALLPVIAACGHRGSDGLYESEIDFLAEDVIELMTVAFQVGENAWLGDIVFEEDIIEEAGPGNDFTAAYDLPLLPRVGLGDGIGRATVRIAEDGVPVADPLSFSLAATTALEVEIVYTIQYEGETSTGRLTDLDFLVVATATRLFPSDPFVVDYFLDGDTYLGATFCVLTTEFRAPGSPKNGIEPDVGDGEGFIDDPDVFAVFDLDLDYFNGEFRAEGHVGSAFFREYFLYEEVY